MGRELVSGDVDSFLVKLDRLVDDLSKWRNGTFGKLPKKVKSLQKEIENFNNDSSILSSQGRVQELEKEMDRLYGLEEHY